MVRRLPVVLVLALSPVASLAIGRSQGAGEISLRDVLLALDRPFHTQATIERAYEGADRYVRHLQSCSSERSNSEEMPICVLDVLLRGKELAPIPGRSAPAQNTFTSTMTSGEGSCAALVATVLALTEDLGSPFDAVILREHVLLGLRASPGRYFEVLEQGREVTEPDLSHHGPFPPGGPTRVGGREYVGYYLDNLAARLAEAADTNSADETFQAALQRVPRAARVHYNYGTFLLQHGRNEPSLYHLTRAIRLGWKDADAFVNRGAALWRLERIKAARRSFKKALQLDPHDRRAASNLRSLDAGEVAATGQ